MKTSELAKELGYKVAELLFLSSKKGIELGGKQTIDARTAAHVHARIPPSTKLDPESRALLEEFRKQEKAEKEAKEAEKKRKEEERAKREAKKQEAARKKAAREAARKGVATPEAPTSSPLPPPPPAVLTAEPKKEPEKPPGKAPKKPTRRIEVKDITAEIKGVPRKPQPAMPPSAPTLGRELLKGKTLRPKAPILEVQETESEVRALRPTEIERLDVAETEEQRIAKAAAKGKWKSEEQGDKETKPKAASQVVSPPFPPAIPSREAGKTLMPSAPAAPRPKVVAPSEKKIEVTVPITVRELSAATGIKVPEIMKKLMDQGLLPTINTALGVSEVELLALEFNRDIVVQKKKTVEEKAQEEILVQDKPEDLVPRAAVVVFMGHVDHGKTSLMDRIRKANVAAKEFGGITQHIGAYRVELPGKKFICFLDTPGHEAFTKMRARGATVTDIAVIVVAADEGVMPQTEEAISHAKAAGVTIMVALNKMDKREANPERAKQQLGKLGLVPEDWGGKTVFCEVSALTGQGVDNLLEMIQLQAEILDLKANPKRPAIGTVLEARKTDKRGPVATVLVQNGTLRVGNHVVVGRAAGRVRAMFDEWGRSVSEAGPSVPVEVLGLDEVPEAGARLQVVSDASTAQEIAQKRRAEGEKTAGPREHASLETLFAQMNKGTKELRVILKGDVRGSLEAIEQALGGMTEIQGVRLKIILSSVGGVSESDVELADASDAIILAFNVGEDERAVDLARQKGIQIKGFNVIYDLIDHVRAAMEGLLEPVKVEEITGRLDVKAVFDIKAGRVAGCMVREGRIERNGWVRVIRGARILHTGRVDSLKRFKEDVKEVAQGHECGVKIAGFETVEPGDILEAFVIREVSRTAGKAVASKTA